MKNIWPDGFKKAITQREHLEFNNGHYPGTRQLCCFAKAQRINAKKILYLPKMDLGRIVKLVLKILIDMSHIYNKINFKITKFKMENLDGPIRMILGYLDYINLKDEFSFLMTREVSVAAGIQINGLKVTVSKRSRYVRVL